MRKRVLVRPLVFDRQTGKFVRDGPSPERNPVIAYRETKSVITLLERMNRIHSVGYTKRTGQPRFTIKYVEVSY